MRIIIISDTHNKHDEINLPNGDLLLHTGDFTGRGYASEVDSAMKWLGKQSKKFKKVIFTVGNHDHLFEKEPEKARSLIPEGLIYLEDESYEYEGITFYASPITPFFHSWAFNRFRGEEIKKYWDKIPSAGMDIILVHGPVYGILDETVMGEHVGCKDLLDKIQQIKPSIMIFGHVHEARGIKLVDGTLFVNASVLNENYQMVNKPIVIDFDPETKKYEVIDY